MMVSAGISLFLGLILVFADKFLSPSGESTLTVNSDKMVQVSTGEPLLSALFARKYFVPSACGGKGTCGYCKVKLPEMNIPLLPTEKTVLTENEIGEGWRLSCQIKVRGDMNVWMPDQYFAIREHEVEIQSSVIIATDTREIIMKLAENDKMTFTAGQYIQVHVPDNGETVYRSYSLASAPENGQSLTLNVKLEKGGLASTWLHSLKKGDTLFISGPYGDFQTTDSTREMVMIAGGVGLAPIISILLDLLKNETGKRVKPKITLFFKVKTEDEFYYLKLLSELKAISEAKGGRPDFTYHLVVSDLPENKNYTKGPTGRITKILDEHIERFKDSEFYLCGSSALVNGTLEYLVCKGIPDERVLFDKFE